MKITSHDAVRILRLYDVASNENTPKEIKKLGGKNPKPSSTLVSFEFAGINYAILFDESIDDETEAIEREVHAVYPGRTITPSENRLSDTKTHAMPYQGKECYLVKLNSHTTRLDAHLARTRPEFSRSSWQQFIKDGCVSVDGEVVTTPKFPTIDTSEISVTLPELETHHESELPIVFTSEDIVVIDKPAGVLTHAKNERDNEFTVEVFMQRFIDGSLSAEQRHGIVHRLDRDTSGLIVCARHRAAYDHLKQQFADREVTKTYHAVVVGEPKQQKALIDIPIARSNSAPGTFMANSNGKPAETYFEVVEQSSKRALLKLMPKTGRTHQLRVHLSYMNLPILGDRLYSPKKTTEDRLYLHASALTFTGLAGDELSFTSDTPKSFYQKLND